MMKKLIAILFAFIIIFSVVLTSVSAEDKGVFGDGLTWEFNEKTGELIIGGTGEMPDFRGSHRPNESVTTTTRQTRTTLTTYPDATEDPVITEEYPEAPTEYPLVPETTDMVTTYATTYRTTTTALETTTEYKTTTERAFAPQQYEETTNWYTTETTEKPTQDYTTQTSAESLTTNIEHTLPSYAWDESLIVPWFDYKLKIKTIIIEDGVKNISTFAFENCCYATSVTIADSVESIGHGAFYDCDNLKSIVIPDSVKSIGDCAFFACVNLKNVTIGKGVQTIGYRAFASCDGLANVSIGNNVTTIGAEAFSASDSLNNIVIPASVTRIGNCAFANCNNLEYVSVDEANIAYSNDANGVLFNKDKTEIIHYPSGKKNTQYTIPETVETIGYAAFAGCISLENIDIPAGVVIISDGAFCDCVNLRSIIIPDRVVSVGDFAFERCTNLQSVTIGENVETIGRSAFYNCQLIAEIIIPDSVTSIGSSAFESCDSLSDVRLGDGVTKIGDSAFASCYNITSILIPDGVTSIEGSVFASCYGLASVTIPVGVTYIGQGAFASCYNLTEITIPDNVTAIGPWAFANCYSLTNVIIPDSVTTMGKAIFSECERLENVVIGNGVSNLGEGAFQFCTSLTNVSIGNSVTIIDLRAFAGCTGLASIVIPDSVTAIGESAFFECSNLISITIPNGVITIDDAAFRDCYSLADVYYNGTWSQWDAIHIGNDNEYLYNATINFAEKSEITNGTCGDNLIWSLYDNGELFISGIGDMYDYSYSNNPPWCNYLLRITSVTIQDGVTSLGNNSFAGCTNLKRVMLPDSIVRLGERSFTDCFSLEYVYYFGTYGQWLEIANENEELGCLSKVVLDCTSTRPYYIPGMCGENLTWTLYIDGELVIGGYGDMYNYNYDSFDRPWNPYRDIIKTVTITGLDVSSVGNYAFHNCNSLVSATIAGNVRSIGESAFSDCYNLTNVTFGDRVTSIGDSAFRWCTGLTSITIPDSVTSIGERVFSSCTSLTGITVSKDNTVYSSDEHGVLFNKDKTVLIQYPAGKDLPEYTIPDSVTSIGIFAFDSCDSLTSVTIGNGVTSIGEGAFYSCDSLKTVYYNGTQAQWNEITIGEGNEPLLNAAIYFTYPTEGTCGENLLWEFDKETGELIISGTGEMYNYSDAAEAPWYNHRSLITTVTIESGVTSISEYAFEFYDYLTTVRISDSVTSIGDYALYGCFSLSSIVVDKNNPVYSSDENGVLFNKDKTVIVQYPIGHERTHYTIPDSVTTIGYCAFTYCDNLTSVTIPDSVMSISEAAFIWCGNLKGIIIPDSVTHIGRSAFAYCYSLSTATIGNGITEISNYAFYVCPSLTSITIPDTVTSIGNNAFGSCESLKSVTIPDSVTSIGWSAFQECASLTNVAIPASVTSIEVYAFNYCDSLTSITVDENNTAYANDEYGVLFNKDKTELIQYPIGNTRTIYAIPDSVTSIGDSAFNSCENLTNISIPDSVTSIGGWAFWFCTGLTSVTIGNGVTSISAEVFSYCYNITDVYYNGTKAQWKAIYIEYGNEPLFNAKIHFVETHEHIYGVEVKNPTCTEDGFETGDCECGDSYTLIIPATGHDYFVYEEISATCTTSGKIVYTCSNCGETYSEKIYATGHELEEYRLEPTCKDAGYECYKCIYCGVEYARETIPMLPHSYEEAVVKEPTCVEEGIRRYTCYVCGDSYDELIPATGEHIIMVIRKEPTCTKIGTEQYLCEMCGDMIGDLVILPKVDHSYGDWTVITSPTATEDGSKEHGCVYCAKTESVTIPALGFEVVEGITIDFVTNTISGFNAGETSLDSYSTTVKDNYTWEYENSNGKLGTGSKAILKDGDTVIGEYTILVYGDTNGDSWYNGQDAIIVDCLANGMLTLEDVGEAVWMAADCNHDGVIDQLDVALLNEAGTLLANVDQTKPAEFLLETSSYYVEYLQLIDQTPEIDIDEEQKDDIMDDSIAETEVPTTTMDIMTFIYDMISIIKNAIEFILNFVNA